MLEIRLGCDSLDLKLLEMSLFEKPKIGRWFMPDLGVVSLLGPFYDRYKFAVSITEVDSLTELFLYLFSFIKRL